MKNSDDAIERVLTGLREAEAPVGMERRILEAVQDRAAVKSARLLPWVWGTALACTMVTCVAISLVYRAARVPVQPNLHSAPAGVMPKVALATTTKSGSPGVAVQSVRLKANGKRAKLMRDSDSIALSERDTASFPAPPMPLTEQEKLLLRVVHHGAPEELAMLNNDVRAKQEADSQAEFQRFFEPATTEDTE